MRLGRRGIIGAAASLALVRPTWAAPRGTAADFILRNGRIFRGVASAADAEAVAIARGRIIAIGSDAEIDAYRASATRVVDLGGRTVVPGLNDSHLHFVRGSLSYDLDVRWDGAKSVSEALQLLTRQAARTPPGQWVRVGGGWSEYQFAERRMPTLDELNAAVPDKPAYVLHFYSSALVNRAGMRALGMDAGTKAPPGSEIVRGSDGEPTGLLLARPLPSAVLMPESKMPALSGEAARASVLRFAGELNRLGLTSVIDPGGEGQPWPGMYDTLQAIRPTQQLGVRLGLYLLPQTPGREVEDIGEWIKTIPVLGDEHRFRIVGAGELLLQAMQDWDLYTRPPVTVPDDVGPDLQAAVAELFKAGWYMREHATSDHTAKLLVDAVDKAQGLRAASRSRWILDHAELVSDEMLGRVAALGGGIAIQHRAAYHGELGREIYGDTAISRAPPIRRMLELGIPVGAGTDGTRDTSYNPWICMQWLVTGRSVSGKPQRSADDLVDLATALRLYTSGSAWFSGEEDVKGTLAPGMLADLAVLSQPIFDIPPEALSDTHAVLTVMDGRVVHAEGLYAGLAPPVVAPVAGWAPNP